MDTVGEAMGICIQVGGFEVLVLILPPYSRQINLRCVIDFPSLLLREKQLLNRKLFNP